MLASQIAQFLRGKTPLERADLSLEFQQALIISLARAINDPAKFRQVFAACDTSTAEDWDTFWDTFRAEYLEAAS